MKRFHVHLGVNDLERSVGFYSKLFGVEPTVRKRRPSPQLKVCSRAFARSASR
jgi:catechol 2,3-dioxygenase-like lactoylglutathione lyase family enzyme